MSPPPLVPVVKLDGATPYLCGSRCRACGQVFAGERDVCANCTRRGEMKPIRLAETGKVYVYTIVYRSFPGAKVPFIDVIVDLDDGSHLKGTLYGVKTDPASVSFGMPVRVIYQEVIPPGQTATYLTYAFAPLEAQEGLS